MLLPPAGRGEYLDGKLPWWRCPVAENLASTGACLEGLAEPEVVRRRQRYGSNRFPAQPGSDPLRQLLRRLGHPLVLLLLFASVVSATTGAVASAAMIMLIVVLSALLGVLQEHRADQAALRLKQAVALRATVRRAGAITEIDAQDIVPGDIVLLQPGQMVPADGRVLAAQDCFVQQAALTGESYPVEKKADGIPSSDQLHQANNALFMGTSILSGQATMLVCATAGQTQIGQVYRHLGARRDETPFDQSLQQFGQLILRVTAILVMFVLVVNLIALRPLIDSVMFALALAVGLTPELLPMVATLTLTRGAIRLSRGQVIVKRLSAIHDLGAVDVLCTDKTGTLTEGKVVLERHLDIHGQDSPLVLYYAWLNCFFESGLRTPLETAVLAHAPVDPAGWRKVDEVPFDFERRRLSVLLAHQDAGPERRWLILKGAPLDVLSHCTTCADSQLGQPLVTCPIGDGVAAGVQALLNALESGGYRTLAVAIKEMPPERDHARLDDEAELTLLGVLAFLDPPKASAAGALGKLAGHAVNIKILTGDSELVTQHVCASLGMPVAGILMGQDIDRMDEETLRARAEAATLFCRVTPLQKNRVILALKADGHAVAYLGDGINDAPALHNADVGMSVDTAVDVAREAADLVMLRQDLHVLVDGIIEGRRTIANMRKYLMMGSSSNFGNMCSMAVAAIALPFLPMQPVQILLNNILYDLSESVIPLDQVDRSDTLLPQHWDMRYLRHFMLTMGPVSSLFDFATFLLLLHVFQANQKPFQTGWFLESLATQVLVIFILRTRHPLRSRPHPALALAAIGALAVAVALPLSPWADFFGFVPLPTWFYGVLMLLVAAYLLVAMLAKQLLGRTTC